MKAFDIHSHFNYGSKFDCPDDEIHKRDLNFLLNDYKKVGIIGGAFSPYSSIIHYEEIKKDNEKIFELVKQNENIFQWVVLDPRQEELFDQIRNLIKNKKVLGIKIHSIYHEYDILEYADKIFSFADELECFVLMHPDHINEMVYYANKYKKMKLIIAHLGSIDHINAIKNSINKNIYTDTSGGLFSQNNILEYAVESIGSEKIFFGTDSYSSCYEYGRVFFSNIKDEDKYNIFIGNANKHFNIESNLHN